LTKNHIKAYIKIMDNKTIVIKIGSRVLTQEDGQLNRDIARVLIEDIRQA